MTKKVYNTHHRCPLSRGGSSHPNNLVTVNKGQHAAWHQLFQSKTAQEIADTINECWLDPDFIFIVRRRR